MEDTSNTEASTIVVFITYTCILIEMNDNSYIIMRNQK